MRPDRFGRRPKAETRSLRARHEAEVAHLATGPTDPELDDLTLELERAGAGARERSSGLVADGPSPAFAADLRARLLASYPSQAADDHTAPAAERTLAPAAERIAPVAERTTPIAERVVPFVARKSPTILPAPRWTALAVAAALILSVVGFNASLFRPEAPTAVARVAAGATLVRDGSRAALAAGTELRVGDQIRVATDGRATVDLGGSQARLAGGAELRIDALAVDRIVVVQLDGRVFHRVVAAPGTTYTVETASLDWTARGTAFDMDREPDGDGEVVTLTAIQHGVKLSGPNLLATIDEGRRAVVHLGDGEPDLSTGEVPTQALRDPWLVENARRDLALGYPIGILDVLDLAEASPPPTILPSAYPTDPTATASPHRPSRCRPRCRSRPRVRMQRRRRDRRRGRRRSLRPSQRRSRPRSPTQRPRRRRPSARCHWPLRRAVAASSSTGAGSRATASTTTSS